MDPQGNLVDLERERLLKALAERQTRELQEMRDRHEKAVEKIEKEHAETRARDDARIAENHRREAEKFQAEQQGPQARLREALNPEHAVHRLQRQTAEYAEMLTRHQEELHKHELVCQYDRECSLWELRVDHEVALHQTSQQHRQETARYLREYETSKTLRAQLDEQRSLEKSQDIDKSQGRGR